MPRALLSVSDKTGLLELASGLSALGWDLLSTGGTARSLRDAGLTVTDVSTVTGHPEMMEGRVKTLHPAVHAGLLARRDREDDMAALQEHGYGAIDMVVVNLYPFHEAAAANAPIPQAMEKVDIGGPSMLRSAAKNHAAVLVLVDPADYERVLTALRTDRVDDALRRELAGKVFEHTGRYDRTIGEYFARSIADAGASGGAADGVGGDAADAMPQHITLQLTRVQSLRYGENPDQPAAFYAEPDPPAGSMPALKQLHGKELSFNNLLDVDAAIMSVSAWSGADRAACVIIKHTTPCGLALGGNAKNAFDRALACDPVSAFGGIVAFNIAVDAAIMSVSAWSGADRAACVIIKHTTPCGLALGGSAKNAFDRALACDPVSAFGGIVAF
ncbi:MAG: bifunctional phosphoribosylaminoimidazolecarboxamide formyltransferase/IMP cyclohydrolase, partial [Longimicrobiales bacterium]